MTKRLILLLVLSGVIPVPVHSKPFSRLPAEEKGSLVINEILYDWRGGDLEFVELYNASDQPFYTDELWIADSRNLPVQVSASRNVLAPGTFLVISRDSATMASTFGVPSIVPASWPILNNTGDNVYLYHLGEVIDSVQYDDSWGGDGVSLERRTWYGPSNDRANWGSCIDPAGATPGRANSLYHADMLPPFLVFAEEQPDNRLELFFDEPFAPASLSELLIEIDGGRPENIEPTSDTSLICIFHNSIPDGSLHLSGLKDLAGNVVDTSGIELARFANPGDVIVNEILYQPRTNQYDGLPNQTEYVEFFSRSHKLLSLRNAYWTGEPDEKGKALELSFGSGPVAVRPGGFVLFYADPHPSDGLAMFHEAFPDIEFDRDDLILIPVARSSLNLRDTGDAVRLFRADGTLLDEVWYTPNLHNAALVDLAGVSLERIDPDAPSPDRTSWGSCPVPSGGTPGAPNALFRSIPDEQKESTVTVFPELFSPDHDGLDDFVTISYSLIENVSSVRLRIFDSSGRLVRNITPDYIGGHEGRLVWDGLDDDGRELRIGIYVVHFEAVNVENGLTETCTRPVVLARPLR